MDRLETNLKILQFLEEYFKQHPDIRFYQALLNLSLPTYADDLFYEESTETLKQMKGKKQ